MNGGTDEPATMTALVADPLRITPRHRNCHVKLAM